MPKYTLGDAVDSGPIPDGTWLQAEILSISKEEKKTKEGEKYWRLKWKFTVTEPDSAWENKTLIGSTSEVFQPLPECKFYNWTQEAMGIELAPGFEVDTDDLLGMTVRVRVHTRDYDKEGQTRYWTEVVDVMRARGGSVGAAAPASAASYADEEPF